MALPPAFSLLHSEFIEFLFAPIGDEENGMPLGVASALVRLGHDPRQEAARPAGLPRATAAEALAPMIATVPGGRWTPAETRTIADRLIQLLLQAVSLVRLAADEPGIRRATTRRALAWAVYAIIAATALGAAAAHQWP